MVYDYFRVTGARDTVLDYADLFSLGLRNDDVQDETLYKLRIRESAQLKTVLELCDMEIHQTTSVPNYQKLKTKVKRCKDQKLR